MKFTVYIIIAILQNFQNKILRVTVGAPYYVFNGAILRDNPLPSIKEVIYHSSVKYNFGVTMDPNFIANRFNDHGNSEVERLKRLQPSDSTYMLDNINLMQLY